MSLGGESAREHHDVFSACLVALLSVEPTTIVHLETYRTALNHGFAYYYWQWDPRATMLYEPLRKALQYWSAAPSPDINLLCELLDFLYFLVWCFDESSTKQSQRLVDPLRTVSTCFARTVAPRRLPPPASAGPYRIAWLAMFAESTNPISVALRHMAPALRAISHELDIYAWRFSDEAFREFSRDAGATWHARGRETAEDTILAVEAQAARDKPVIVISDMNNAVPTALFSRRLAPVQIFLQGGMPAWPVQNLDAVFNSFGFDSEVAGWGEAEMLGFNPPWDLAALDPPVGQHDIVTERAALPKGHRLIGSFGRLVKITRPYLDAAEQILMRCKDTALVLGGTGDPAAIKAFIAASLVGERIHVAARFVPGHIWTHILEVFLDTCPVTGGESCRQMIANGKPVVTLHSREMPAIDLQRDPTLVARDWTDYVDRTVRLLEDPSAYAAACQRARALASRMSDSDSFVTTVAADIVRTVESVRRKMADPREAYGRDR